MNFPFKKTVSAICIAGQISLLYTAAIPYAQGADQVRPRALTQEEKNKYVASGHNYGYDLTARTQDEINHTSDKNGKITFGNRTLQQAVDSGNSTLGEFGEKSLTPVTSGSVSAKEYYSSGKSPQISEIQSLESLSDDEIGDRASDHLDAMDTDLGNEKNSGSSAPLESQAYATIRGIANTSSSLSRSDPMFKQASQAMSDSALSTNPFEDCELDKKLVTSKKTVHTPDYRYCSDAASKSCTLTHDIMPSVAMYLSSTTKFGPSTGNAVVMNLGAYYSGSGATLSPGSCEAGTVSETIRITNPDAIKTAYISRVTWAGAVVVTLPKSSKNVAARTLFAADQSGASSAKGNSAITDLACSSAAGTQRNSPMTDLTELFKNTKLGGTIVFNIAYKGALPDIELTIAYDPSKLVLNDSYNEPCYSYAKSIGDGSMKGTVSCKQMNPACSPAAQACTINGATIKFSELKQLPGLSPGCSTAEVRVDPSNVSSLSVQGADVKDSRLYDCSELASKGCGYSGEACALYDDNNICVIGKKLYDCGTDTVQDVVEEKKTYDCPGPISCMGKECVDVMVDDSSEDFHKAIGLMQEAQELTKEVTCTTSDGGSYDTTRPISSQSDVTCKAFGGERQSCRSKARFTVFSNNCCTEPGGAGDVAKMVRQIAHLWKVQGLETFIQSGSLDSVKFDFMGTGDYSQIYGLGWDMFKNYTGAGQAFTRVENAVTKPVVNLLNNVIPYAGDVFKGLTYYAEDELIAAIANKFLYRAIKWVAYKAYEGVTVAVAELTGKVPVVDGNFMGESVGGDSVGGLVQNALGQVVGQEAAATVMSVVSFIGWAYAIYSAAKMIASRIIACKDDEIKLQSKLHFKQCDHAGSYKTGHFLKKEKHQVYCCFSSPLTRILNKQLRAIKYGCAHVWPANDTDCAFTDGHSRSAKNADCEGIDLKEMGQIDWKQVDLTEWLSLLATSGGLDEALSNTGVLDATSTDYLPIGGYDDQGNYHGMDSQVSSELQSVQKID